MLRWFVLALLLANVMFWAWGHGWLAPLGLTPTTERDPARLQQQVRPDSVRVVAPTAAAAAVVATSPVVAAPVYCLESGPIAATEIDAAEQALAVLLPERGWIRASRDVSAQYVVVIGPLAGRAALQARSAELTKLRIDHEELSLPGERDDGLGLVLGRYDTSAAAQSALEGYVRSGVRSARALRLREAVTEVRLRIENVAADKAESLRALKAPALGATGLVTCGATSMLR
jgi:hypothetical protein